MINKLTPITVSADSFNIIEYDRIKRSKIFDYGFYSRVYADLIPRKVDPLLHFMIIGSHIGLRPREDFDPVLYKIIHPESSKNCSNPLTHYLDRFPRDKKQYSLISPYFPHIKAHLQSLRLAPKQFNRNDDNQKNRSYSKELDKKSITSFSVGRKKYNLIAPEPEMIFKKIRDNEPFSVVRLPHGFWDSLVAIERVMEALSQDIRTEHINMEEKLSMAARLCREHEPHVGNLCENFIRETILLLDKSHTMSGMIKAVSFKGYPTFDNRLFHYSNASTVGMRQLEIFSSFSREDDILYDATLWKRFLISGCLNEFACILKQHPVIVVGPPWFHDFGRRWELENFEHIKIYWENSHSSRHPILERISRSIIQSGFKNAGQKFPVVIFQCGASLSFWLINKLHEKNLNAFLFDLGQALIFKHLEEPFYSQYPWLNIYKRQIVENNNLEEFYKKFAGTHFSDWLN